MNLLTTILIEKLYHKGAMHKLIESGGTVPLNEVFGIRITPTGSEGQFVAVQLVSNGVQSRVKYSMAQGKKKKEKEEEVQVEFTTGSEELFK